MEDVRLVYARQIAGEKDAWRRPGSIAFAVRTLEEMAACHPEGSQMRIQIEYEIKRLYAASKEPPLMNRGIG